MKTAEDKAEEWVHENVILAEFCDMEYSDVKRALTLLLKEQDRDTRHACAEAVLQCEEDVSGACIWKDAAHAACMNVKAV